MLVDNAIVVGILLLTVKISGPFIATYLDAHVIPFVFENRQLIAVVEQRYGTLLADLTEDYRFIGMTA